jgi:glycosyltransferase involved in cell wall biosynthesis
MREKIKLYENGTILSLDKPVLSLPIYRNNPSSQEMTSMSESDNPNYIKNIPIEREKQFTREILPFSTNYSMYHRFSRVTSIRNKLMIYFSKPKVTVIIIFLNAEEFFEDAIKSVLLQTFTGWELLLVDDGSTDKSTRIARKYEDQYPIKIRYLEHKKHRNLGMSASRNLGIRKAKAEYIAFLDADDLWLPEKLERQVQILENQSEAVMVYGSALTWYSWTGNPDDVHRDRNRALGVEPDRLIMPPTLVKLFLEGTAETPGTCSALIRREAIKKIRGFDETFKGMYEDQVFFYKLCLKFPVFIESGCWDRYRQHPKSACQLATLRGEFISGGLNSSHLNFLKWFKNYLIQQGIHDTEVWQALNFALDSYEKTAYCNDQ